MIKARDTKTCIGKKKIMVFHNRMGPIPGRGTNWVIHEYHLQPDRALPDQRPYVIYRLENKDAKKAGSAACEEGEPSSSSIEDPVATPANSEGPHAISILENKTEDPAGCYVGKPSDPSDGIISGTSDQVAPTAILNVHGRAEENADLPAEPLFSLDDCFTLEDLSPIPSDCHTEVDIFLDGLNWEDKRAIFSDYISDDQQINMGMHKNHPTPENSLPQGPHAISSLGNKTEDPTGCYVGEPSDPSDGFISGTSDQVTPTAILNVHGQVDVNGDQNTMQASCGANVSEELYIQWWNELYGNYLRETRRETKNNLPNDSLQPTSLKRSHPPASVDTDVVGVGEQSKRSHSLAPGELLPYLMKPYRRISKGGL